MAEASIAQGAAQGTPSGAQWTRRIGTLAICIVPAAVLLVSRAWPVVFLVPLVLAGAVLIPSRAVGLRWRGRFAAMLLSFAAGIGVFLALEPLAVFGATTIGRTALSVAALVPAVTAILLDRRRASLWRAVGLVVGAFVVSAMTERLMGVQSLFTPVCGELGDWLECFLRTAVAGWSLVVGSTFLVFPLET